MVILFKYLIFKIDNTYIYFNDVWLFQLINEFTLIQYLCYK